MLKSRSSLASYVCSLLILWPSVASAECFEAATAPAKADCVVMARGENRGVWFSLKAAIELQQSHLKIPELTALVTQLEEVNTLHTEEIELYQKTIKEHEAIQKSLQVQADDSIRRARRAEEQLDAWHRSPWLWLGIGIGTTLAIGITAKVVLE
jgi:hypothetical protein